MALTVIDLRLLVRGAISPKKSPLCNIAITLFSLSTDWLTSASPLTMK